MFPLFLNIALD